MKNTILSFLLGIFVTVSIAATTNNLMTVKPAVPKETVVKSFRAVFGLESDVENYIKAKIKNGYIVKSVSMMDDERFSKAIVVMEKY